MRDETLVRDVKRAFGTPKRAADLLRLKVSQSSGSYVLVLCPMHGEKNASLSLYQRDGQVKFRCWGCGKTGDMLALVAELHGLDLVTRFPDVLATACELVGMRDEAEAVRNGRPAPERRARPAPPPDRERPYPPVDELEALWQTARHVTADPDATRTLTSRGIDPERVAALDLARVLHPQTHETRIPSWAWYRGKAPVSRPWTKTGHRMLVRAYDAEGQLRSLRAWLVVPAEDGVPKRVPPAGFRSKNVVLANARAVAWLRGERRPSMIIAVEGEPDFVVRSLANPTETVIGILSGSWHEGFAERVPYGSEVVLRTHIDDAGERYATEIRKTIEGRAVVRRWTAEEDSTA